MIIAQCWLNSSERLSKIAGDKYVASCASADNLPGELQPIISRQKETMMPLPLPRSVKLRCFFGRRCLECLGPYPLFQHQFLLIACLLSVFYWDLHGVAILLQQSSLKRKNVRRPRRLLVLVMKSGYHFLTTPTQSSLPSLCLVITCEI